MKNNLSIQYVSSDIIKEYSNNAKIHNDHQINQIAKSIKTFGMLNPVLLNQDDTLIAGHGRLLALKKLGHSSIPCVYAKHLTKSEVNAYRIADNKLSENAQWDTELLTIELKTLDELEVNFDFDTLGFDAIEVDSLLHYKGDEACAEEVLPEIPQTPISQMGDIFHCGPHRVGCGDCRDHAFIKRLFKRSKASICITDSPYNVPIAGHVRGKGKDQFTDFTMASGEMTSDEFTQFLLLSFLNLKKVCKDGSLFYLFCDWRMLKELFAATDEIFTSMLNLCVWKKSNGGMGSFYRSKHELVGVFKHGKTPHVNNVQLGKYGRDRCNVWNYPGVSSFGKDRDEALAMHPTVKPVAMLKDILLDASKPNDIVIDGFLGSGSTLIAAEKVRRRCFGVEIDPKYVDVILNRYRNDTGDEPIHVESGLTFSELEKLRSTASGGSR